MTDITTMAIVHTTELARMRAFVEAIGFTRDSDTDDRIYASPFTPGCGLLLKEVTRLPYAHLADWIFLEFNVTRDRLWAALRSLEAAGFDYGYFEHPRTYEGDAVDPDGRTWHFLHYF